jgi:hypothetical protein
MSRLGLWSLSRGRQENQHGHGSGHGGCQRQVSIFCLVLHDVRPFPLTNERRQRAAPEDFNPEI